MSNEDESPIKIKMRVGSVEVEVECKRSQVKDVVEKVLSSVMNHEKKVRESSKPISQTARAETCKGVIQKLWMEGWFTSRRSLEDVHNEMMRIGFHYDRTAVAHSLLDLVREGILTREGKPKRYLYIQKKPPKTN